jgi:hypothetical protein
MKKEKDWYKIKNIIINQSSKYKIYPIIIKNEEEGLQ